jgi:hypothetical protein
MHVAMKLSQELGSLEKGKKPPPDKPAEDFTSRTSGVGLSDDEYTLLKQKDGEGKLKIFEDIEAFKKKTQEPLSAFVPQTPPPAVGINLNPIPTFLPQLNPQFQLDNQTVTTWPQQSNNFSLSIARPKLDFPTFSGENAMGWLRQCEKYFSLANVPMDIWVSMATLHCQGVAEHWWRGVRIPSGFMQWSVFTNMVLDRFSPVSHYGVVEQFNQTKQVSSVNDYILKFEEQMSIMQRAHPQMTGSYFVQAFIAGLKDSIKHYLIPHNPISLIDCYWKARELEKGNLAKKTFT